MKKILSILVILISLTLSSQTLVVKDSITPSMSVSGFTAVGKVSTNPPTITIPSVVGLTSTIKLSSTLGASTMDTITLSKSQSLSLYDSIVVRVKITNRSTATTASIQSMNITTNTSTNVSTWQTFKYSTKSSSVLNANLIKFKISLIGDVYISNLTLIGYRDSVVSTTTSISKSNTNIASNVFTFGNILKSNSDNTDDLMFTVFSLDGKQLITTSQLKQENELNLSNGIYLLNVISKDKLSTATKKIVIQN